MIAFAPSSPTARRASAHARSMFCNGTGAAENNRVGATAQNSAIQSL